MSYSLISGDLEPDMLINLAAPGAIAALATALQVQMLWKKPDGTTSRVSLVVVDPVAGIVKRVWATGDSAQVGTHRGLVEVTAANGELVSDPNDGSMFPWNVYARAG